MILGIGSDIVEIKRLAKHIAHEAFLCRVLTPAERAVFATLAPTRKPSWLAGRFAAKEAISKALGAGIGGKCSFQDLSILANSAGAPQCVPSTTLAHSLVQQKIHITISHSEHYAEAFAVREHLP